MGANPNGFIRAGVTARQEPLATTIGRALGHGLRDFKTHNRATTRTAGFRRLEGYLADLGATTDARELVIEVSKIAPVLLVIDEFGKNLEYFSAAPTDHGTDLFVLQELAEWSSAENGLPVLTVTLQHLAFDEYLADASDAHRRELSKIQGRFHDIPYLESAADAQRLVVSAFTPRPRRRPAIDKWAANLAAGLDSANIASAVHVGVAECYPLHPIAVAVLPDLCARYGQNERTLFSFLAGPEPDAVPAFLDSEVDLGHGAQLTSVGLDRIYEFFVGTTSTTIAASAGSSRWLEIETRIRDSAGLTDLETCVLKTVGVLNLVTAGGLVRASRAILELCLEAAPTMTAGGGTEIDEILGRLEGLGLLTYRDFADEYRIWQGTDFDLRGELQLARLRVAAEPLADLLERIRPADPVVAGRHTQETGTLRFFCQRYVDQSSGVARPASDSDSADGLLLLSVGEPGWVPEVVSIGPRSKPIVLGTTKHVAEVTHLAYEHAAYAEVLTSASQRSDWVAVGELRERLADSANGLDRALQRAFSPWTPGTAWFFIPSGEPLAVTRSLSSTLSDVCDKCYRDAPPVRNEMLARQALTSQGARGRSDLVVAMVENEALPCLGIDGYGPERAMYEALLGTSGLHRVRKNGQWGFGEPREAEFKAVWRHINTTLDESAREKWELLQLHSRLAAPPIGLKQGPIPILVLAALLARSDEIGVYEEGSFVPSLTSDVAERLLKNPDRFSVRNYALRGPRADVVIALADALGVEHFGRPGRAGTLIGLVAPILKTVRALPEFAVRTRELSVESLAVRQAIVSAREPDELLFVELPAAIGLPEVASTAPTPPAVASDYADRLVSALRELRNAYPILLDRLEAALCSHLGLSSSHAIEEARSRASHLVDRVLDPSLKAFVNALANREADRIAWLEQLGMVVSRVAPQAWRDDDYASAIQVITQASAAFQRIESLYYSQKIRAGEPFDAVRVGVTLSNGSDAHRVVWADKSALADLEKLIDETVARARLVLGDRGPEMLLAELAQRVLLSPSVQRDTVKPSELTGEEAHA